MNWSVSSRMYIKNEMETKPNSNFSILEDICLIFGIFHALWWFSWMFSLLSSVDLSKQSARESLTTCVSLSIWICVWILYRSNRHLIHQIIYLRVCREKTSKNHSSTHIWVVRKWKSKLETEIQQNHSRVFYFSRSRSFFYWITLITRAQNEVKWFRCEIFIHDDLFAHSIDSSVFFLLILAFSQSLVRCCISRACSRTHAHWQSANWTNLSLFILFISFRAFGN